MGTHLIGDTSEVVVGRGRPRPLLPPSATRARVALLVQPGAEPVGDAVADGLDVPVERLALREGEEAKTLEAVGEVYAWLARIGLGRDDTVVVVGGGAATDAGGFIASTWGRGVEAVHVPTTLLGAVDAAIGGKTAINIGGKNLVGTFWLPRRVVVDLDVLEALPERLRREGAAEVIKAGFIAAPGVVDAYRRHGVDVPLESVVEAAVAVKTRIAASDLRERGERALLNLGHTVGHAVEFASGLSHGESVAIGMVAEAHIAAAKLGFEGVEMVVSTLERTGLPTRVDGLDRDRVMELMWRDKKRDRDGLRMVLLREVGRPEVVHVEADDVWPGLEAVGV
jgi:3-dehydroquinate synthetase